MVSMLMPAIADQAMARISSITTGLCPLMIATTTIRKHTSSAIPVAVAICFTPSVNARRFDPDALLLDERRHGGTQITAGSTTQRLSETIHRRPDICLGTIPYLKSETQP